MLVSIPDYALFMSCRQPFIAASAIAAVAWDTADAIYTSPSQSASGSPDVSSHDAFHYRNKAIKQIDAEILLLLQGSTVFSFATLFHDTMLRYVYLRRALQGRASIDEVLNLQPLLVVNAHTFVVLPMPSFSLCTQSYTAHTNTAELHAPY